MTARNEERRRAVIPAALSTPAKLESVLDKKNLTTRPREIKRGGRIIGEIRPDGVLQKHIRGSVHFLRKPWLSIAWDISVVNEALQAGAFMAEVHEDESGQIYHATIADIQSKGFKINYGSPQIALPVSQWRNGRVAAAQPEQLEMFGGVL